MFARGGLCVSVNMSNPMCVLYIYRSSWFCSRDSKFSQTDDFCRWICRKVRFLMFDYIVYRIFVCRVLDFASYTIVVLVLFMKMTAVLYCI